MTGKQILVVLLLQVSQLLCVRAGSYFYELEWLRADGTSATSYVFREGETAIAKCRVTTRSGPPINSFSFEWKRHNSTGERVIISQGERLVYTGKDRGRFSQITLAQVSSNTVEYRLTVRDIDRYDSDGYVFFCRLEQSSEADFVSFVPSKLLRVSWVAPSPQCSADVARKAKKGESVVYQCSASDTDGVLRTNGSLSLWKDGDELSDVVGNKQELESEVQYSLSHKVVVTDDYAAETYMCRFVAFGGFMNYDYNCTFDKPVCVVVDTTLPCGSKLVGGAETLSGNLILTCCISLAAAIFGIM